MLSKICLGIDASNLREGGGLTHLIELLRASDPASQGISRVVVWGGQRTLNLLPKKEWLTLRPDPMLNQSLPIRLFWQKFKLSDAARRNCDILFVPGGSYAGSFRPYIMMSQNVLPFENSEYRRYGISWMALKMNLLRISQTASFRGANGTIFVTEHARKVVLQHAKRLSGESKVVAHGIDQRFRLLPRPGKPMESYSQTSPFRLLYVSNIYPYKHQWNVAKAVHELRQAGLWVELDLVGSAYQPSLQRLQKVTRQIDPDGKYIHYHGIIPYSQLPQWYHSADGFVFASSCESFSLTLLEAMAAGLPIACSNRGPMPEILGDAGIYFDPEQPGSIVEALMCLIKNITLRKYHAHLAFTRAQDYTWERCARETLDFIFHTTLRSSDSPDVSVAFVDKNTAKEDWAKDGVDHVR
jgi:glycosyltransferase involved in cell wall biosynthesis